MRTRSEVEAAVRSAGYADWVLLLSLIAVTVLVFWRLALTDLIIGRGDLFFYFYPYREYASQSIQSGRIPLWNPYSFMGVPFLANSQAGVLYPLNILLAGLPVTRLVNISLVAHAVLAGFGTYLWARRRLGLSCNGSWLSALVFALGGYFVAQIEHLNQFQVLAWLPWLLWLYNDPTPPRGWLSTASSKFVARIGGLALVIALQVSAGHIQSVFICMVGLCVYALLPLIWRVVRRREGGLRLIPSIFTILAALACGSLLAAFQLLPTLELSQLSVRSGGLVLEEAVSFSLPPDLLTRALLPSWGGAVFPEYVAYIGVSGLGLALFGAWAVARIRDRPAAVIVGGEEADRAPANHELARVGALALVLTGLFLALGGYNPVYLLFVKLVPGFASFRAPARWLVLYAIGMSGLVGVGFDAILGGFTGRRHQEFRSSLSRWFVLGLGALAAASFWALLGERLAGERHQNLMPAFELTSIAGWFAVALPFAIIVWILVTSSRAVSRRIARLLLVNLVLIELIAASGFLPLNRTTAPGALTSMRPAVAHLLAAADVEQGKPAARFLSISDILFDPGDKAELEIILDPQISDDAVYDYLIATKQKEVLIPNLPLYYRLPAMDGYDGGVLPLRRYVTLEQLYLPEGKTAFDGRLREYLDTMPDGRWLSLFNVKYVITDKVGDAWYEDVFYDMQMGAELDDGSEVIAGPVPQMPATALGVVFEGNPQSGSEGGRVAAFDITFADGEQISLPLLAADALEAADDLLVARLSWDQPAQVSDIRVRVDPGAERVTIRATSIIDERTGAFLPVALSDVGRFRLVHSGDVKIYENLEVLPRAHFVSQAEFVRSDEEAISLMSDPQFDPRSTVVLLDNDSSESTPSVTLDPKPEAKVGAAVEIVRYEPENVIVQVNARIGGWLVLSDAWYPGWQVSLDGARVPVERANVLFRAVKIPEGEHEVEWAFRPSSYRYGALLSLLTVLMMVTVLSAMWIWARPE